MVTNYMVTLQVWTPESHRTLSQCFWNIANIFLLPLVILKKKTKSHKGLFFKSPKEKKKEFRRADQSDASGYFSACVSAEINKLAISDMAS